jgi:hypothetical protein
MWYVPTVPLGLAMLAVAAVSFKDYLAQKRGDALRSFAIAFIPVLIIGTAIAIRVVDKKIETAGTWVITEHANAAPIFESGSLGIDFSMSNDWFTLQYSVGAMDRTFDIAAEQDGKMVNYDFNVGRNQVFSGSGKCIAAREKSDRPITQIQFGETMGKNRVFQRSTTIALPDTFKPELVSNADWDRGISRGSGNEVLLAEGDFSRLMIKKGDEVQISPTDHRIIASIEPSGASRVLRLDGGPIHLADGVAPVFGIIRK